MFSLARPQIAGKRQVELRGLDLVVAMDVSKSMLVDDVEPTADMATRHDATRLARARELAAAVIDELPGDRIAPVVFAGAAAHFPLTEDRTVAASPVRISDRPTCRSARTSPRCSACRAACCGPISTTTSAVRAWAATVAAATRCPASRSIPRSASRSTTTRSRSCIARGKAILSGSSATAAMTSPEARREVATARELGIAVILVGVGSRDGGVVHEIHDSARPAHRSAEAGAAGTPR